MFKCTLCQEQFLYMSLWERHCLLKKHTRKLIPENHTISLADSVKNKKLYDEKKQGRKPDKLKQRHKLDKLKQKKAILLEKMRNLEKRKLQLQLNMDKLIEEIDALVL